MDLEALRAEITHHPANAWATKLGYSPVYMASTKSRIVIVGQAPGRAAQESGIPWNDVSGDKLREWLGLSRNTFYDDSKIALMPMDFYFPGKAKHGDLPPRPDFAPMWHPQLLKAMPNVELILPVGSYAQKYYLGVNRHKNLTETVLNYEDYLPDFMPLVHPSPLTIGWRARNPWFETQVIPTARKLIHSILDI